MKLYKVKVNGKVYEVELEEVTESNESIIPSSPSNGEETEVKSFIQGTVTEILVKPNQSIKKGQVLISIEAMKMQNEIVSPVDGTIVSINVTENQKVQNQELLMVIG